MPTRIIREGINSSKRVNKLTPMAEIFYRRLFSVVDDYGRYYASPATLRGACWPICPEKYTDHEVREMLAECLLPGDKNEPLISLYENDGIYYLQVNNFRQKARSKSKFPEPASRLLATCGQSADNLSTDCGQIADKMPALVVGEDEVVFEIGGMTKSSRRGQLPDATFMDACKAAGIDGSETDWEEAGFEWRKLDFEQKLAAVEGIRIRIRDAPDDPALKSLPQNYIKKRMWQRPMRQAYGQQQAPKIKMVRM